MGNKANSNKVDRPRESEIDRLGRIIAKLESENRHIDHLREIQERRIAYLLKENDDLRARCAAQNMLRDEILMNHRNTLKAYEDELVSLELEFNLTGFLDAR